MQTYAFVHRGGSGSIDESPVKASTTWESWGTGTGTGGAGGLPVTTSGSGSSTAGRSTIDAHITIPKGRISMLRVACCAVIGCCRCISVAVDVALTLFVAVVVAAAASALGGIDNWSASVGKIAVGSGFDPTSGGGGGGGGASARPPERLRESSRLASTFGVATAPVPSTQQVDATGGVLETTDPLAIDAFASSGFGALPSVPTLACSTRATWTHPSTWSHPSARERVCTYVQGIRLLPPNKAMVTQLRQRHLGRHAESVRENPYCVKNFSSHSGGTKFKSTLNGTRSIVALM